MANGTCSVADCRNRVNARKMCSTHYGRWLKTGSPLRECPTCGAPIAGPGRKRYCSAECWPPCSFDGCKNRTSQGTGDLCASHCTQKRHGELKPIKRYWSTERVCVVCGAEVPEGIGRRKHCSSACQVADSRHKSKRPESIICALCGRKVTLRQRDKSGRLMRTDTIWCWECGRQSPDALRFKKYGITPDVYAAAVARGCEICGEKPAKLHIDHDHECCPPTRSRTCGKCVRGLICGPCNRALGMFKDNPATLLAAIGYLERIRGVIPLKP